MSSRIAVAFSAFAAVSILTQLAGCNLARPGETKSTSHDVAPAPQHDPMEVKVQPAFRLKIRVGEPLWAAVSGSLSVPGRVEADETRLGRVGSQVAGRIAELNAVEGQSVHRGQVLATLNSTELSEGQFGFLKAQSQANLAGRAATRAKQLLDAGVIGMAELQRREADYAQVSAELTTWHDRLRVLGMSEEAVSRLETTRTVNSLAQVVASIEGVILERKVTPGQVVQPADTLFVIGDLSHVWLVADVPEQASGMIRTGKAVRADIPALPDQVIRGRLTFVSAVVNPETRTVRVRMDLPNPGLLYKPAMLANIQLQDRPEQKQLIPATAVVREGNQDHVFVATAEDTFVMKPVTLGAETNDRRILAGGLEQGKRIVLDGAFHLNNERKRASLLGE